MDPMGAIIFGVVLILSFRYMYEVWTMPDKFHQRIKKRRQAAGNIFGFSFWSQGKADIFSVRFVYTFIFIISLLGFLTSLVGIIDR